MAVRKRLNRKGAKDAKGDFVFPFGVAGREKAKALVS